MDRRCRGHHPALGRHDLVCGADRWHPAVSRTDATTTHPLRDSDGLIADFTGPGDRIEIGGEFVRYGDGANPIDGPGSPTYSTSGGTLHITDNAPATAAAQYLGV